MSQRCRTVLSCQFFQSIPIFEYSYDLNNFFCILLFIKKAFLLFPGDGHDHFKFRVLYQRPRRLKVLYSILTAPNSTLFWIEISDFLPAIFWSHFYSLGATVPSSNYLKLTEITLAFTFHIFLSSSLNPWYSFFLIAISDHYSRCLYFLNYFIFYIFN